MDSEVYKKKHNGRTLVDDAFLYIGLTGRRNYEKYFNIVDFLENEFGEK